MSKMEVVCRSEMFTAAGTHGQENLRHRVREVINKGDKPGLCSSYGKEMQITRTVIRGPALITAGCASTDKMVYAVR
jgi:hypothetical protein